ncbi:MAG: mannose-1-phosphate guanylyltransferase [Candidatus Omnitrophica bacterium]|nr:mannose-1-phosphate guanylyltransferase [Candidatus Omnitrophota bacterium]
MTNRSHIYAVILAGGSGTRFWPLSRASFPKQFLALTGKDSLLQQTVQRVAARVPQANILILTNQRYRTIIKRQLSGFAIPPANILYEPSAKNTAPAIGWAASVIHGRDPQAVMGIFPSDHLIRESKKFLACLDRAIALAQTDFLVTFGITPTRPETGYGYFQTKTSRSQGATIHKVARFVEKPDIKRARQYLRQGNYFWNSGMFVWKAGVILEEFRAHLPNLEQFFRVHLNHADFNAQWAKLEPVSIDYGVLEKSQRVVAVLAPDLGWSDLGSWESLAGIITPDSLGNVFQGQVTAVGSSDNFILSGKKLIALVGVKNMVIVDTPDALMVCRKDASQEICALVKALRKSDPQKL